MSSEQHPGGSMMTLGFWVGLVVCLALGASAVTLQDDGSYSTDELLAWLRVVAVVYTAIVAIALVLGLRGRGRLAGGLALGATLGTVVAPTIVFIEILMHSE